jgi:hypothetical protein
MTYISTTFDILLRLALLFAGVLLGSLSCPCSCRFGFHLTLRGGAHSLFLYGLLKEEGILPLTLLLTVCQRRDRVSYPLARNWS